LIDPPKIIPTKKKMNQGVFGGNVEKRVQEFVQAYRSLKDVPDYEEDGPKAFEYFSGLLADLLYVVNPEYRKIAQPYIDLLQQQMDQNDIDGLATTLNAVNDFITDVSQKISKTPASKEKSDEALATVAMFFCICILEEEDVDPNYDDPTTAQDVIDDIQTRLDNVLSHEEELREEAQTSMEKQSGIFPVLVAATGPQTPQEHPKREKKSNILSKEDWERFKESTRKLTESKEGWSKWFDRLTDKMSSLAVPAAKKGYKLYSKSVDLLNEIKKILPDVVRDRAGSVISATGKIAKVAGLPMFAMGRAFTWYKDWKAGEIVGSYFNWGVLLKNPPRPLQEGFPRRLYEENLPVKVTVPDPQAEFKGPGYVITTKTHVFTIEPMFGFLNTVVTAMAQHEGVELCTFVADSILQKSYVDVRNKLPKTRWDSFKRLLTRYGIPFMHAVRSVNDMILWDTMFNACDPFGGVPMAWDDVLVPIWNIVMADPWMLGASLLGAGMMRWTFQRWLKRNVFGVKNYVTLRVKCSRKLTDKDQKEIAEINHQLTGALEAITDTPMDIDLVPEDEPSPSHFQQKFGYRIVVIAGIAAYYLYHQELRDGFAGFSGPLFRHNALSFPFASSLSFVMNQFLSGFAIQHDTLIQVPLSEGRWAQFHGEGTTTPIPAAQVAFFQDAFVLLSLKLIGTILPHTTGFRKKPTEAIIGDAFGVVPLLHEARHQTLIQRALVPLEEQHFATQITHDMLKKGVQESVAQVPATWLLKLVSPIIQLKISDLDMKSAANALHKVVRNMNKKSDILEEFSHESDVWDLEQQKPANKKVIQTITCIEIGSRIESKQSIREAYQQFTTETRQSVETRIKTTTSQPAVTRQPFQAPAKPSGQTKRDEDSYTDDQKGALFDRGLGRPDWKKFSKKK
jgi:hypothetical protein